MPGEPLGDLGADRLDEDRPPGQIAGRLRGRDDDGDAGVHRHVAVVEAERRGDHPRAEVVVHRHRFAVDGVRVQCRVRPLVDRDPAKRLAGRAVTAAPFANFHPLVGGMPIDLAWSSPRLFEREVLPALE
jgi:hypothetical protein